MSVEAKTTYLIRNEKTGLYLTLKGDGRYASGDIVQDKLYEWPQRARQAWRLEPGSAGEHTYRLQNQHTGRYLRVHRGSREPGIHVELAHLEENTPGYKSQTWRIGDKDDHRIVNVASGLGLSVRGDSAVHGASIVQQSGTSGDIRVWRFEQVEPRGVDKAFDSLIGTLVEPSAAGILTTVTSALKASLEVSGGIFGTVSKWVPGSTTPYIRFDGFRGGEYIGFSQRNRVENGPRRISEEFPHLPKEFHEGFDFVTRNPRSREYPYLGVKGEQSVAFSEKGLSNDPYPARRHFPLEGPAAEPGQTFTASTPAAPDGSRYLVFGERGTGIIDVSRDQLARQVDPVELTHLPAEFRTPDAIASAALGQEMHFFATKGDHYLVFTFREVLQGPAPVLDAYPFLLGLWS